MSRNNHLTITFHDVVLEIHSGCEDFLRNIASHLPGCVSSDQADPHITIRFTYVHGTAKDHGAYRFPGADRLERIGYWTFRGEDRIDWNHIWELPGLKLSITKAGDRMTIDAVFHEIRDDNVLFYATKRLVRHAFFKERYRDILNQLLEYLVYFPLSWYLEVYREMHLLHASALEVGGRAMIFGGLSGVGKSTISAYLFTRLQAAYLSDNLVYYDTSRVYPCFEPILLSQESGAWRPQDDGRLLATDVRSVYGRTGYLPPKEYQCTEAVPTWAFLLNVSRAAYIHEIPVDQMLANLIDSNEATGETKRYHTFAAQMNLLYQHGRLHIQRSSALEKLLSDVRCFKAGLYYDGNSGQDVEKTILSVL